VYATTGNSTTTAYQRIRTRQRPPACSRAETPARPAKSPATTNAAMPGDPIATRGRNSFPAVDVGLTVPTMTGRSASHDKPNASARKTASARGRRAVMGSVEVVMTLTPREVPQCCWTVRNWRARVQRRRLHLALLPAGSATF
jgi:hypothetical protein